MSGTPLLDGSQVEIKLGDYGVADTTALIDPGLLPRVQEYRRLASARMYPLSREDVREKIPTAEYHVSRKVDGEFAVLVFRDGQLLTLNPGGTVRIGLPLEEEARQLLSAAGVREAMIAGELYVENRERRPRVHDVTMIARQPQSEDDLRRLRFAVFDILSLDGQAATGTFAQTWRAIERIFGRGTQVHPVEARPATDAASIERLFEQWVEKEGAEGLVVRSDTAGVFKVKPRHNLDAVVIGFTESIGDRQGLLHDLLLAVMRSDGTLHVLSRVGGGFSEDDRRAMLSDLKDMVVESEFTEVNSDHLAYQMVHPSWVVEISCLDLISQTTRGGPVNRMVLDFTSNGSDRYHVVRRLPLASVISPQFIRRREDKVARPTDVRIEQVSQRVEVQLVDRDARQLTVPRSELLRRAVYAKTLKGERMVRKFVMWKTNKETQSDDYSAFVVHYTDFSPNRQTPLEREVRVSSSWEQIVALWDCLKTENIKKGWELYSTWQAESQAPATEKPEVTCVEESVPKSAAEEPEELAPKMAASQRGKKRAAKKKTG